MTREVKIGQVYKHFKGSKAVVITLARHSETNETLVVYACVENENTNHEDGIYARPLSMFLSEIDHEKYPNVTQKYRFELEK